MMEQNLKVGVMDDICHILGAQPQNPFPGVGGEDCTLRVSVEIRAHSSPLTIEVEKARHLLPSLPHLQSLDIWSGFGQSGALPWPEPGTTEGVPQRAFSRAGGSSSCGRHVQIPGYQQQQGHHSGPSPGCGTSFPGFWGQGRTLDSFCVTLLAMLLAAVQHPLLSFLPWAWLSGLPRDSVGYPACFL